MNYDISLAQNAAAGDVNERQKVTDLVFPLVSSKTKQFCKQYCSTNKNYNKCTLDCTGAIKANDQPLCGWGNGSIAWMLNDLTNENRLNKFEGRENASLLNYLSKICNSFQFQERWKDWRFRRRIRVPLYIKAIDIDACRIYWWLCDKDSLPNIAQRLGRPILEIEKIHKAIIKELYNRNKLHNLQLPTILSLTNNDPNSDKHVQMDIPSADVSVEDQLQQQRMKEAFEKLNWKEQFILKIMVIDQLDVRSVLKAIQDQDVSIKNNVSAAKTNISQVYYFRNKTIDRLKELAGY